ncbi:Fucolectin-1, partial [Nibea albiflora]
LHFVLFSDLDNKPEYDWIKYRPLNSWKTSSTSYFSSWAVDGRSWTCSYVWGEKNPWWRIDLMDVHYISSIAIYNYYNYQDISGAQIQIGNSSNGGIINKLVTNITDFKMGCWNVYQTNTSGRYITVFHTRRFSLCEVRINTTEKDFFQPNDNWITFQSSESCSGGAVDRHETNSAAILKIPNSLWRIDLLGVYNISSVAVYNKDLNNADMSDAWIQIGNSRMKNTESNTNKRLQMGCWNLYQTNTSGRYITVSLPGKEDFSLCEVRINGTKKESPFVLIRKNKTWENALEYCRTNHRDLASIRNEEEQAWAELEAKEATTEYVWLGLHYTCVLEFWFWVADYPLDFHHWAPEGMTEECDISVAMKKTEDHQWFSQSVYNKFHFLCEKRNQCLV